MLVSQAPTERLDLPHEPGEWIDLRKLSSATFKRARAAAIAAAAIQGRETAEALGISLSELMGSVARDPAATSTAYDEDVLLEAGIVAWSYSPEPSPATIADLDQETRELVLSHLVPRPRTEADRKNGSASSTMHSMVEE